MKKGCLILLGVLCVAIAAEFALLDYLKLKLPWYAASLLGLSIAIVISNLHGIQLQFSRWRASKLAPAEWKEGMLIGVSGKLTAREPLLAPFSKRPVAMYEYEVKRTSSNGDSSTTVTDFTGFGMSACAVQTRGGSVPLVGFPLLVNFPKGMPDVDKLFENAGAHFASATWTKQATSIRGALGQLKDVLDDPDGLVKIDFVNKSSTLPMYSEVVDDLADDIEEEEKNKAAAAAAQPVPSIDFEAATKHYHDALLNVGYSLEEQVVEQGAEVSAFGTYHTNPPRLNIGSGLTNLSHTIAPGNLGSVIGKGITRSTIAVIFWGAVSLGGHWYVYGQGKSFPEWIKQISGAVNKS